MTLTFVFKYDYLVQFIINMRKGINLISCLWWSISFFEWMFLRMEILRGLSADLDGHPLFRFGHGEQPTHVADTFYFLMGCVGDQCARYLCDVVSLVCGVWFISENLLGVLRIIFLFVCLFSRNNFRPISINLIQYLIS